MRDDVLYLMGAGTTVASVMSSIGLEGTLLGVDAVLGGELLGSDLSEEAIWRLVEPRERVVIVLTFTGAQGFVFGRGNQQFSARILRRVGRDGIRLLATKSKLIGLEGRPLLIDSGDRALDEAFSGLVRVRTGYEDEVLYRLEAA